MVSSPPTRNISDGEHNEQGGLYHVFGGGETIAMGLGQTKPCVN